MTNMNFISVSCSFWRKHMITLTLVIILWKYKKTRKEGKRYMGTFPLHRVYYFLNVNLSSDSISTIKILVDLYIKILCIMFIQDFRPIGLYCYTASFFSIIWHLPASTLPNSSCHGILPKIYLWRAKTRLVHHRMVVGGTDRQIKL